MSVSYVQSTNGFINSGTTLTLSYGSNVSAGDFLIAVLAAANTGGSAVALAISDNVNGNWTKLTTIFSAFSFQTDIWYFNGSQSGSITVTMTTPSSMALEGGIAEYAGVSPTNPFDGITPVSNTYGSTSSFVCPNLTTISANDWVIGILGYPGNPGTVSASGSYNLRTPQSPGPGAMFSDIPAPAPGSYTGCTYTVQFAGNGSATSLALAPFVPTAQPSLDYSPGAGGVAIYSPKAIAW